MATETVAMVGTRKGLWIGRSDERRERWTWDGPHFDMQEVYSCMVDTRGGRTAAAGRGGTRSWSARRWPYSDDLGGTWEHGPDGAIRFPEDTGASVERVWQLAPGVERRRGVGRHRAGRGVPLRRPRRDLRARARAVGPPAPPGVGRRLRRPGVPHVLPHPTDAAVGDRGDLDRRRLPDHRRRRLVGAAQPGHPGRVPARGPAVPRVRPVRAQGGPAPRATRSGCSLQNHGGVYRSDDEGGSWTSIADGLPSDFGFPIVVAPARRPTPSTCSRSRAPTAASRRRARRGSGAPATPARPGSRWRRRAACPTASSSA